MIKRICDNFSDEGLDGLKVWYWMPLPKPPKMEI